MLGRVEIRLPAILSILREMYFSFYRFRIYQQAKIELFIFDITRFCQNPCLTQVKFGQNASELPFASLERVLALNVSQKMTRFSRQ